MVRCVTCARVIQRRSRSFTARRRRELPIQQIGRRRLIVIAHSGDLIPLARPRLQPLFQHAPNDAFPAVGFVEVAQVLVDTWTDCRTADGSPRTRYAPALSTGDRLAPPRFRPATPGGVALGVTCRDRFNIVTGCAAFSTAMKTDISPALLRNEGRRFPKNCPPSQAQRPPGET